VHYDATVVPYRDRPVQRQSVLQSTESPSELTGTAPGSRAPFSFGSTGGISDVIQLGGRARYAVQLFGAAIRAGFAVPRPSLETVGDKSATEVSFRMAQAVIANWFGVPIYKAEWAGEYVLENGPGQVKPVANIKEGVDQNGLAICKC
jgi:hypothetical protein